MNDAAFPVHIDLGTKQNDLNGVPVEGTPKGKSRKIYPTLYIEAVPGLDDLPKEGCVMIKYRRTRLNIETPEEGDDKAGVTLEIRRICMPKDMEDDDAPKDLASVMDGEMNAEESEDDDEDE